MTVATLVDQWLDTKVAAKVAVEDLKQKTAENYRDVAESYVKAILGDSVVRISALRM